MTSGVYLIQCSETGKVYVGSSKNIEQRWLQHKYLLKKGEHHSIKLQNAWNKYGVDAFTFFVIEQDCPNLVEAEQKWINSHDAFKAGFNSRPIADRPGNKDEPTKSNFIKVRLSEEEYEKLRSWANAYGDDMSGLVRRMLDSLPDKPPTIPQPPVKL
jgi:group I intron endonuclease